MHPNTFLTTPEVKKYFFKDSILFDILACISDSYLLLTTAHTQAKKTSIQHCPPSPPQGGDRFDLCVFISYKY